MRKVRNMTTETKKRIGAGVLAVVAAGVLSGGIYVWWLFTPPPMPQTVDEARAVLTSSRFANLSSDRQADYARRIRELLVDLDDEQRQAFFDQVRADEELRKTLRDVQRQMIIDRAKRYALADELEKQLILDELMAEFMQMRSMWARRRAEDRQPMTEEQRAERREQRRNEMIERMGESAATGNPQHGPLVGQMMRDLRDRMGDQFPGRGRGGGGGGGRGPRG